MVGRWIANNPLTIEERRKIKEGIDLGMSYREIGLHVGRAKSTVLRESKRISPYPWNYDPDLAQLDFEEKQKKIRTPRN